MLFPITNNLYIHLNGLSRHQFLMIIIGSASIGKTTLVNSVTIFFSSSGQIYCARGIVPKLHIKATEWVEYGAS